jgi:hypothetical protein
VVSTEVGSPIEVGSFGHEHFSDVVESVDHNRRLGAEVQSEDFAVALGQRTERLVRHLVSSEQMERADDGPGSRSRKLSQPVGLDDSLPGAEAVCDDGRYHCRQHRKQNVGGRAEDKDWLHGSGQCGHECCTTVPDRRSLLLIYSAPRHNTADPTTKYSPPFSLSKSECAMQIRLVVCDWKLFLFGGSSQLFINGNYQCALMRDS